MSSLYIKKYMHVIKNSLLGWQVANVLNNDQPVEASRYPAAVLRV